MAPIVERREKKGEKPVLKMRNGLLVALALFPIRVIVAARRVVSIDGSSAHLAPCSSASFDRGETSGACTSPTKRVSIELSSYLPSNKSDVARAAVFYDIRSEMGRDAEALEYC